MDDLKALAGRKFLVRPRTGKFLVEEIFTDGSRLTVATFGSEAVAVAYRRNLPSEGRPNRGARAARTRGAAAAG